MKNSYLQKYFVDGKIIFSELSGSLWLKLEEEINFTSPYFCSEVKISSPEGCERELNVEMTVKAKSQEEAIEKGKIELKRVADLLGWFWEIPIIGRKITIVSHQTQQGDIRSAEFIGVKDEAWVTRLPDKELRGKLKNDLERKYPENFEEAISMWQEAISNDSDGLKYLLLYRILEKLIKNKERKGRKEVDRWILSQEPQTKMIKNSRSKKKKEVKEVTIFTYLRDQIHPKQPEFPFDEIKNYLPKLQNLARKAISNKFSFPLPPP